MQEKFGGLRKSPYLCTRNQGTTRLQYKIGIWCNGNTADSGPAFPGSSPGTPTRTQSLTALRFTSQRSFFDVLGRKSLKSQANPTQPRNRLFRCVGFSFARCTIRK